MFYEFELRIYLEFRVSDLEFTKKPRVERGFFVVAPPIPLKNSGTAAVFQTLQDWGHTNFQIIKERFYKLFINSVLCCYYLT